MVMDVKTHLPSVTITLPGSSYTDIWESSKFDCRCKFVSMLYDFDPICLTESGKITMPDAFWCTPIGFLSYVWSFRKPR